MTTIPKAQLDSTLVDTSSTQTLTNKTLTSPSLTTPLITGRTSGSAYAAGQVGEKIESTLSSGSATALTTATAKTITSITLTAGVWLLIGNVFYNPAATTTISGVISGINTTTNALPGFPNNGAAVQHFQSFTAGTLIGELAGSMFVNISASTTYYLIGYANFATSTMTAYGYIGATRIA